MYLLVLFSDLEENGTFSTNHFVWKKRKFIHTFYFRLEMLSTIRMPDEQDGVKR